MIKTVDVGFKETHLVWFGLKAKYFHCRVFVSFCSLWYFEITMHWIKLAFKSFRKNLLLKCSLVFSFQLQMTS